jgi:hypothetical protein
VIISEKNDNKGCETFFIMIVKEIENIYKESVDE